MIWGYVLILSPHLLCKSLAADIATSCLGPLNLRLETNEPGDRLAGHCFQAAIFERPADLLYLPGLRRFDTAKK